MATFLGAVRIGAVALPLSTLLRSADFRYMLADSRAKALVVDAQLYEQIAPLRSELPHLRHVIVVPHPSAPAAAAAPEPGVGHAPSGCLAYAELVAAASPKLDSEATSKDDMCFWQYSSGTTGFPKAAVHLQHDLAFVARAYGRPVVSIGEDDRVFSIAKLFFSYGLGNSLALPMSVGACTILMPERPEPAQAYDVITRERPTLFFAVPTFYAALLAAPSTRADLSSLRLCVSAGEALPKALYKRWRARFGVEILDGIGSTEVGYIFVSNFPGRARPGTSGQVVAGYEVRITDPEGASVAPGGIGDLWVKGDSICACYWNKHERTKRTLVGEWIATGDRYSVDPDRYYTYAGRSDDMLKVGAMWVSPIEIEGVLIEHAAVLECAVVGRLDEDELVKPAAYVVLKDGGEGTSELARELQTLVKERLAPYKCPRWIDFVAELPKTATGKIQRYRLREQHEEAR